MGRLRCPDFASIHTRLSSLSSTMSSVPTFTLLDGRTIPQLAIGPGKAGREEGVKRGLHALNAGLRGFDTAQVSKLLLELAAAIAFLCPRLTDVPHLAGLPRRRRDWSLPRCHLRSSLGDLRRYQGIAGRLRPRWSFNSHLCPTRRDQNLRRQPQRSTGPFPRTQPVCTGAREACRVLARAGKAQGQRRAHCQLGSQQLPTSRSGGDSRSGKVQARGQP